MDFLRQREEFTFKRRYQEVYARRVRWQEEGTSLGAQQRGAGKFRGSDWRNQGYWSYNMGQFGRALQFAMSCPIKIPLPGGLENEALWLGGSRPALHFSRLV